MAFEMDKNQIELVVFDWAGTLIDAGSNAPVEAMIRLFREHGFEITEAEARGPMGLLKRDHIREILSSPRICDDWTMRHGPWNDETLNQLNEELEQMMPEVAAEVAQPIPGVTDMLDALRGMGLKLGSTTGYTRRTMDAVLPVAAGYGIVLDEVITSDEVRQGRPYPWMIYANMERLGVCPPSRVVKVGDTVPDILEARNAGVWAVGVVENSNELGLVRQRLLVEADSIGDGLQSLETLESRARQQTRENMLAAGAHFVLDHISALPGILEGIETGVPN